jgi:hypothetical protein
MLTRAVGCGIVMMMKGPASEADPYSLPGRDQEEESRFSL